MVCLGVFFGCRRAHRSFNDYVVSALAIIAILSGLRLLYYAICRLSKKENSDRNEDSNDGLEFGNSPALASGSSRDMQK